jgi:hypothetical protein
MGSTPTPPGFYAGANRTLAQSKIYRPKQWNVPMPSRIVVQFPGQGVPLVQYSPAGIGATLPLNATTYVFDCVILADHDQRLRKTEHPIQTCAAISDHAFIEPATLSLDVGMSDSMQSYSYPSVWTGNPSKSVSAYQTLLQLMFSRIPLTVTTRLRTYYNMIVESLRPQENAKTIGGLRCRVEFGQVFLAYTTSNPSSVRGWSVFLPEGSVDRVASVLAGAFPALATARVILMILPFSFIVDPKVVPGLRFASMAAAAVSWVVLPGVALCIGVALQGMGKKALR